MVNLSTSIGPSAVGRSTMPWNTRLVMVTVDPVIREGLAVTSGGPAPTGSRVTGVGGAEAHGAGRGRGAGLPLGLVLGCGALLDLLGAGATVGVGLVPGSAGVALGEADGSSACTMPP